MDENHYTTPQVIADTYEILGSIGSGGGGVVYLAQHRRLNKKVVLKADKRDLSAKSEVLRREVDALKNMSHTYIPQVYDFIIEHGTVYTVMDYIEGESLDKPLKRGERFAQAQVVEWACQLLEALVYLHSRPPHGILHADIKPANVMVTPQGDICLIDFNIALALGAEGAVAVGRSFGYASPEHYGTGSLPASTASVVRTDAATDLSRDEPSYVKTILDDSSQPSGGTSSGRKILLDVRSDIYSVGATLYHLLSGKRPARNAVDVVPLLGDEVSPQVAGIIAKAMEPNADLRYQTAEEMLWALEHLWENDPRTKRLKRNARIAAAALTIMLFAGAACSFTGLRQMQQAEEAARVEAEAAEELQRLAKEAEQAQKEALSAVGRSEDAYRIGDIPTAVEHALRAIEPDTPYRVRAQKALTDALGVYDLADSYKAVRTLTLPSEPLKLSMSPGGTRLAAVHAFQAVVFDLETGAELASLPLEPSALSDVVFLDENRLIFAGDGAVTAWDLSDKRSLWTGGAATGLALSADGRRVAAVYKVKEQADIYDTATGELVKTISFQGRRQSVAANDTFADPEDSLLALDRTGRWLAVSFDDGTLAVFDTNSGEPVDLLDPSGVSRVEGGFFGPYFAFSTWDGSVSAFAVVDMDRLVQTGGFSAQTPFHLQVDERGICISSENLLVQIDPVTGEQAELAYPEKDITVFQNRDGYTIVADAEGTVTVFNAQAQSMERLETGLSCDYLCVSGQYAVIGSQNGPVLRLLRRESHPEAELISYDPAYSHDEARLSADGSTVMLFSADGFRLYDRTGTLLAEAVIPDPGQIYDQQYRREADGTSYLEVIYNSGLRRAWSAKDGALLWERTGDAPDSSLFEEFFTDRLRIESPLHGTPAAYDRQSGELVSTLDADAYLTYVTQVKEGVVCEYVSSKGERYGLLMDENCVVLARFPNLCDIVDGTLVFDYSSGNLRQSRIYSTQELIALAKQNKEEST